MSSLTGTALSRDYRSIEPLSSAIACIWNRGSGLPELSNYASGPCGGSLTKPPIAVLLSPDLASGIRRVKGVKKAGGAIGKVVDGRAGETLWQCPETERLKGKRDRALPAVLLACGLRRHGGYTRACVITLCRMSKKLADRRAGNNEALPDSNARNLSVMKTFIRRCPADAEVASKFVHVIVDVLFLRFGLIRHS
jgi:hypothetical protein